MFKLASSVLLAISIVSAAGVAFAQASLATLSKAPPAKVTGREAISQPFSYEVDLNIQGSIGGANQIVNQPLSVAIAPGVTVSGIVESFELLGTAGKTTSYRLRLVPPIRRLAYRSRSRSFMQKSVKDIVTSVLLEAGLTEGSQFTWALSGNYPVRELVTQYRETDLEFVSRLLERAGIHYHFEPSGVMVLSDGNGAFSSAGDVPFSPTVSPGLVTFERGMRLRSGQVETGDYSFKTPSQTISGTAQSTDFAGLMDSVFPGGADITNVSQAQARANNILAVHVGEGEECSGEASSAPLRAGSTFKVTGSAGTFDGSYIVTSVEHTSTGTTGYRRRFTCVPTSVVYKPQPITPVPVIAGFVPAIVVGPAGETKYVDIYGRVKVRFPWRPAAGNATEGDVGWIRVVQPTGGMLLPAVGQEVAVAFEHGDPDRPVVLGTQFNAAHMPPVALPANKQRAILNLQ